MTLNEKLFDAVFDNAYEFKKDKVIPQCEQIAEDFAIEFTDWCENTYYPSSVKGTWFDHFDFDNATKFSTKQLLQIYKQTL